MSKSTINTPKTVLILGATGGFGSALTTQMSLSGWQVRAMSRRVFNRSANDGKGCDTGEQKTNEVDWFVGSLDEPASLKLAAQGVDMIVHSVNVPYPKWDPLMLDYTRTIIDLARDNDAHLMFVGNIYNAGLPENGVITEHTINAPINEKGEIRANLEDMLEAASHAGVRSTIVRFGDFFGPGINTSNWFNICTKGVLKNKMSTAGPVDLPHTWAYLPDAAKATERVASIRIDTPSESASDSSFASDPFSAEQPAFIVLPFAGHVFSFSQLQDVIEELTGTDIKAGSLPWPMFKLLGFVWPVMRDILSMRYLWNHDIQMDGSALTKLLGSAPEHTPLAQAVIATVPGLADSAEREGKAA